MKEYMKQNESILERYYRGETNLEDERQLKQAYRNGDLQDDPALAYANGLADLPPGLEERIRNSIRKRQQARHRKTWVMISGIAATLILIISVRGFWPGQSNLYLSDSLKKTRLEEALRVIGQVLEEDTRPTEQVLYEDERIIIVRE